MFLNANGGLNLIQASSDKPNNVRVLEFIRKPTLRSLFLGSFLLFSMTPLLFYALGMGYWIQSIFEKDQEQRFAIEQNAATSTWEKVEKKIESEILSWTQSEQFKKKNYFSKNSFNDLKVHPLVKNLIIFNRLGDYVVHLENSEGFSDQKWKELMASFDSKRASPNSKKNIQERTPSSETPKDTQDYVVQLRNQIDSRLYSSVNITEEIKQKLDRDTIYGTQGFSLENKQNTRSWLFYLASVRDSKKKLLGYLLLELHYPKKNLDWLASTLNRDLLWFDVSQKKSVFSTKQFSGGESDSSILYKDLEIGTRNRQVVIYSDKVASDVAFKIRVPYLSTDYFKKNLIYASALMSLLIGVVILWASIKLSRSLTKPLSQLVDATELVSKGDYALPVESGSTVEFQKLTDRFNSMAQSVYSSKQELQKNIRVLEKAHSDLKQTQNQLVQSEKLSSLGQLVAGVAHELNNPIAFIYSNMTQLSDYAQQIQKVSELLDEITAKQNHEQKESIQQKLKTLDWHYIVNDIKEIARSGAEGAQRVKDIVLGLRNFSRADSGEIRDFDLRQLVIDTVKIVQGIVSKNVKISVQDLPELFVEGNRSQLGQVILNILVNSVQAVGKEGHIQIKMVQTTGDQGTFALVQVQDNGPGISKDVQSKIFDPFFTTKKIGEGTGLGLSIAYGIMRNHNGEIRFESRQEGPQKGTTFSILLPVKSQKNALLTGTSKKRA